mmetsp:Transcript_167104/g.536683  ORF Transcript_167104/g.536683 Transcript_167104/m.536683 type:complete len:342 (-) Transcript_167104:33-1058(-)
MANIVQVISADFAGPNIADVISVEFAGPLVLTFLGCRGLSIFELVNPKSRSAVAECRGWKACIENEFPSLVLGGEVAASASSGYGDAAVLCSLKALVCRLPGMAILTESHTVTLNHGRDVKQLTRAVDRARAVADSKKKPFAVATSSDLSWLYLAKFYFPDACEMMSLPQEDDAPPTWLMSDPVKICLPGGPLMTAGAGKGSAEVELYVAWGLNEALVAVVISGRDPPIVPDDDFEPPRVTLFPIDEPHPRLVVSLYTAGSAPLLHSRETQVPLDATWAKVSGLCAASMPQGKLADALTCGVLFAVCVRVVDDELPKLPSASTYNLNLEAPARVRRGIWSQ